MTIRRTIGPVSYDRELLEALACTGAAYEAPYRQ
jgi:hypothetical protein